MQGDGINRREFLGKGAAVGLGVLNHPGFSGRVFGANDRLVMGLIGAGGRGRGVMQEFIQQGLPAGSRPPAPGAVEFTAVCDVYEVNLDLGIEMAGGTAKGYRDYRQLLARKDIDAVLIATPEHWHHRQLIDSVAAGKDAYCEKPMSHSIEEGAEMVAAVGKTDRIVQVGMQRRSSPGVIEAKKYLDDGTLGEVNLVRAEWYWNTALHTRPVMREKLDWERFVGPAPRQPFDPVRFRNWRYFWDFSGGNMTDQGTHLIDVIQWFMGVTEPVAAVNYGAVYKLLPSETPDTFVATFEYPKFTCSWTLCYSSSFENGWAITFHGHKATMEMCEAGFRIYPEPWKGDHFRRPEPTVEKLPGDLTATGPHVANFLECVRSRKQPNATVEIGHQAVRTLHLANIAGRKQARAVLAEDGVRVKV